MATLGLIETMPTKSVTPKHQHIFLSETILSGKIMSSFISNTKKQDESVDTVMSEWQKGEIKGKYYTVLYFLQMMV